LNSFAQSGLNFCAVAISNHFVTLRGGMTDARVPLDFFRWSQSEGNGLIHSHSLHCPTGGSNRVRSPAPSGFTHAARARHARPAPVPYGAARRAGATAIISLRKT
jgi:hypothetical protein